MIFTLGNGNHDNSIYQPRSPRKGIKTYIPQFAKLLSLVDPQYDDMDGTIIHKLGKFHQDTHYTLMDKRVRQ